MCHDKVDNRNEIKSDMAGEEKRWGQILNATERVQGTL